MPILFAFSLFVTLLGFNVSSVNAQSVSGCMAGDNFSRTTGQACTTATVRTDCQSGDLFSSLTGQPCNTTSAGGAATGSTSNAVSTFNSLFGPNLRLGGTSDNVKALQQFLKDQGYYFGKIDGKYGRISAERLVIFKMIII